MRHETITEHQLTFLYPQEGVPQPGQGESACSGPPCLCSSLAAPHAHGDGINNEKNQIQKKEAIDMWHRPLILELSSAPHIAWESCYNADFDPQSLR